MPDMIGNIAVPEIAASGVFPLTPDYPIEVRRDHEVVVHQFGSGNAKIEQRFLLGTGTRRFSIRKQWVRDADRIALRNFWETKYGPYGAFTFNAPNDDGGGTTPVTCRFANEPLSWEIVADWACSLGVTLIEIPTGTPSHTLSQTVNRFAPASLQTALLSQVQEIIPLVRIQPLESGYPAIHLSDRRCTIGGQLYQARLLEFDGISQGMGNEADEAQFSFGNADRVMRDLANDVDLYRAALEFSLFHVGTGIKLDLWKGEIVNWNCDAGPEFRVTAADGLYELNLPYPTRKISRMGIAQSLPDASKNTYDFLVNNEGYGLPASRRLPYADYGLALAQAVTANPAPQTIQTSSYGANRLGLTAGQFVFLDPGGANEEYVKVVTADPDNQTFDAIVTKDHAAGERMRPAIWPTPTLNEGDDLAFDILSVASPDSGSDLTLVIQT